MSRARRMLAALSVLAVLAASARGREPVQRGHKLTGRNKQRAIRERAYRRKR